MSRLALTMLLVCGGCQFTVQEITGLRGNDSLDLKDSIGGGPADGGVDPGGDVDLAGADSDLTADPCGNAPPLGAGNLAAQCVIGAPPVIDGKLDDWPAGSFSPMTHAAAAQAHGMWHPTEGANDADSSARFAVQWDQQFLYLAARITDDIRQTPNGAGVDIIHDDSLELFFDGKNDRTVAYGDDDWQLIFSAADQRTAARGPQLLTFPSGVVHAIDDHSPNWNLEVKIPWSVLGGAATVGRLVGFDLKLDDDDNGLLNDRDLVLFYAAPPGGTCLEPGCRTDAFGAVQLQGR